ncbi:Extracellular exo-alpha-(1-_5)-L-arabinofuranosidase [Paramyrothecium foliicola]|nr:Extracellular exo-alpha-(1->5)-L-arabinofuranosidase [Paramyrothecium foliicola]
MRLFGRFVKYAATLIVGLSLVVGPSHVEASPAVSYTNSLVLQRADPHIFKHTDGWYYFTATVPAYDRIILRRSQTIQGLANAAETTIWVRKSSGVGSGQVWAPEIHFIDGKWYVYVALGVAGEWRIRPFVLEGTGSNPLTASWVEKGIIKLPQDTFSLDASTFVANGRRYLIWAQDDRTWGDSNTSIMIAPLQNPWTIQGTPTAISRPDRAWERVIHNVNEGPFVIQKNGKIFLTYSASATDSNYCMGLLVASATSNLLDANSWSKSPNPIFVSNSNTNQWGPGHNSFTVSEDGQSDIMVYHDRGYRDIQGDPLNDPNRRTRVQKVYWRADGTPDFGIPIPEGKTPVRLRSHTGSNLYVRHLGATQAQVQANVPALAESQFRIVSPGLAGGSTVSFESTSNPGQYLRHYSYQVRLNANDNSAVFKADASFIQRAGLANSAGISFEASNFAGYYLCSDGGNNLVVSTTCAAVAATFYTE